MHGATQTPALGLSLRLGGPMTMATKVLATLVGM